LIVFVDGPDTFLRAFNYLAVALFGTIMLKFCNFTFSDIAGNAIQPYKPAGEVEARDDLTFYPAYIIVSTDDAGIG
jgi:hypothetical protein